MAWVLYSWVLLLASVLAEPIPDGVLDMECHERSFVIAVDLSFAGDDTRFEAVDETGTYAIAEPYAAKCGYTVVSYPLTGRLELRASYFSCHTEKKESQVFAFRFNMVVKQDHDEVVYVLNKTCSPSLEWSQREVSCEVNYMEVSLKSEALCTAGKENKNWNVNNPAYGSSIFDWQVMFQRNEEQMMSMSLSDAREQGYMVDVTGERLLFRSPNGKPESFIATVDNILVEVVHATLFSRQRWLVVMVDLVAACSMDQGSYEDSGQMVFQTPVAPYPGPDMAQIRVGFDGGLYEGEDLAVSNDTLLITIPLDVNGGLRKSVANGSLYEFYTFNLYLEQLFEEDEAETRLRLRRTLTTPLLPHLLVTQNESFIEERIFQVELGDVPEDVRLVSLRLNGQEVAFTNSCSVSDVIQPGRDHGYRLRVSFDHPAVMQQYSRASKTMQYSLDITFTLSVLPENDLFYHTVRVTAEAGPSPPVLDAVCSESGIHFTAKNWAFGFLWSLAVGSEVLTPELAARWGYQMTNSSQKLELDVPVYSQGFHYEDITLEQFLGTFEILIKEQQTSTVLKTVTKTCPFPTTELIVCSTDGRMTVVANLSLLMPRNATPATSHLLDTSCGPLEADDSRALFSLSLISCGSKIKLSEGNVIYQNEIFYSKNQTDSVDTYKRLVVQCLYPLESLHRLFSMYRFDSDNPGLGKISSKQIAARVSTTALPDLVTTTKTPQTGGYTSSQARRNSAARPQKRLGSKSGVRYVRVSKHGRKGVKEWNPIRI
ncbi:zona pellucida protein AX 4 [Stigmatopora nigra]